MIITPPLIMPIPRFAAHKFYVEIDKVLVAFFNSCKTLQVEMKQPLAVIEGGNNNVVRNLPTQYAVSPVTLKYGIMLGDQIWTWFKHVMNGEGDRRDVTLLLYPNTVEAPGFIPVAAWMLMDCLPTKYKGPDFTADTSNVACDEITIQPSSLVRLNW